MFVRTIRVVPLAALMAGVSAGVQAGAVGAGAAVHSAVTIADDGGYQWQIDLAPLVSIDQATGAVSLNPAPGAAASAVGSDAGEWTLTTVGGQTALQWHSWTRIDGTIGTDTNGGTTPWRSVLTVQGVGGNLDPEMSYDIQFRNNGAGTQTFTYTQGETMDGAVSGPFTVRANLGGTLSNASSSSTGLTLSTVGGAVQSVWLGNAGVAAVNAGVDLGVAAALPVGTALGNYGTFAAAASGAGSYDYWEFRTSFTLSGGKDAATLSGYAEILTVPDAGGLALALSGLLALAGWARHGRRD